MEQAYTRFPAGDDRTRSARRVITGLFGARKSQFFAQNLEQRETRFPIRG
jgi:hypothetical protein